MPKNFSWYIHFILGEMLANANGIFPSGLFPAGLFPAGIFHDRAFSRVNYCVNYDKKCLFNANLIDGVRRATDSY